MSGVRLAELDVVFNAVIEQVHALKDHAEIAHQTIQSIFLHINAAQLDRAAVHIPKAGHEAGQGSLTGAGGSHDGCGCPFRDGKAHIINDFPVSVREIHMVKYNVMAFGRLNRAALVYSWRLVNFLYPINRGINHR